MINGFNAEAAEARRESEFMVPYSASLCALCVEEQR
jgi:hypothetical protein